MAYLRRLKKRFDELKRAQKKATTPEGELKKTREELVSTEAALVEERKSSIVVAAAIIKEVSIAREAMVKARGELVDPSPCLLAGLQLRLEQCWVTLCLRGSPDPL